MKSPIYARILGFCSAAMLMAVASLTSMAADKADPTGVWKWEVSRNGDTREMKLNIKKEDGKLTGTISGRQAGQDNKIEDIKVSDEGKLTFVTRRERNGQKFETKYAGKIDGDTLKGDITFNANGQDRTREWTAKRESSAGGVSGKWTSSFTRPDGNKMEYTIELKQEGDKLTGKTVSGNGNETAIKDGSVKDGEVSFKVVRERDGRTFTSNYSGKVQGDAIKGKIESDFNGNKRSFDWEAKKAK
jgi:hypothetical protein